MFTFRKRTYNQGVQRSLFYSSESARSLFCSFESARKHERDTQKTTTPTLQKLTKKALPTMSKSPSLRRIQADIRELAHDPSERYHASPLENDMFEWYVLTVYRSVD
jgi:hypothetical protein